MDLIRKIGGLLIVVFGIHVTGLVNLSVLLGDRRIRLHKKPAGYAGSVLVGVAFAAGWTPCIGPILASILMIAATEEKVYHGMILLFSYSLGLGTPFFISSLALHKFLVLFNRFKKLIKNFRDRNRHFPDYRRYSGFYQFSYCHIPIYYHPVHGRILIRGNKSSIVHVTSHTSRCYLSPGSIPSSLILKSVMKRMRISVFVLPPPSSCSASLCLINWFSHEIGRPLPAFCAEVPVFCVAVQLIL